MSKLDKVLKDLPKEEATYVKPLIKALMLELIGENQYGPTKEIEYERNSLRDRMRKDVGEL